MKPKFAVDDRPKPKGFGWLGGRILKIWLKARGYEAILVSELMKEGNEKIYK